MKHIGRSFHASHIVQTTYGSLELPYCAACLAPVPDVELKSIPSTQTTQIIIIVLSLFTVYIMWVLIRRNNTDPIAGYNLLNVNELHR